MPHDGARSETQRTPPEELLAAFGHDLVPESPPLPGVDDRQLARCVQALTERERSVVVMTFYDAASDDVRRLR